MIIGICGKSGSGKSTLAKNIKELSKNEVVHLEIDKVGHRALLNEESKKELVKEFGEHIIKHNNVDRKKLGDIVFNSREKMQKLTDITWECMQKEIDKFIEDNKDKIVILDWLLLTKSKYFDMCDIKILLDVPYEVRKMRAIKRDSITSEAFDLRERASIEFDKEKFDYVLENSEKENIRKKVLI